MVYISVLLIFKTIELTTRVTAAWVLIMTTERALIFPGFVPAGSILADQTWTVTQTIIF